MTKLFIKLKAKWGITRSIDFWLIMIVFSLAGMGVVFLKKPIFLILHVNDLPLWVQVIIYIPLIMPLYQISLLFFGFLLGQFKFFWEKQKQIKRFIFKGIKKNEI